MTDRKKKQPKKNKLANTKSPYLLQHAENPVDWYPWGDEAFEKAIKEEKPIFLSIGYSTCHWCHVMAHESFEDEEVARLMNKTFINIKVDREERPDIDGVYMHVAQLMTGSGGWPLTVIMTPDKKPFFAGTYIPKLSRYDTIGLLDLIPRIAAIWRDDKKNIDEVIQRVENALNDSSSFKTKSNLTEYDLMEAFSELSHRFDEKNGGFGNAPKFPSPHNLLLVLRHWKRTGDDWALHIVEKTLTEMRNGGIFDQVGYGFHRYSTDSHWLVPHFEKMLYDQAGLMAAYTETYQITKNVFYADVVREIYNYVIRDLKSPNGAFYSAEDADSEGVEGKFYVWSKEEIDNILTKQESDIFCKYYNIRSEGNFLHEATGVRTGENILHITGKAEDILVSPNGDLGKALSLISVAREKLFSARKKRIRPFRDEKILTDWNAFMISAMAKAGIALNDKEMIQSAEQALDFLIENMLDEKGELFHRYSENELAYRAFLDDYAYLIMALLDVYDATFNTAYLARAKSLCDDMLRYFLDEHSGGLFFTGSYAEDLLIRRKDAYDCAIPSGNSIAMFVLLKLARMLGDENYENKARAIADSFSANITSSHSAFSMMLVALDFAIGPSYEIVIAGDPSWADTQHMLDEIQQRFLPRKVLLFRGTESQSKVLNGLAPFTRYHTPLNRKATAHVCINFNCKLPTNNVEQMLGLLGER